MSLDGESDYEETEVLICRKACERTRLSACLLSFAYQFKKHRILIFLLIIRHIVQLAVGLADRGRMLCEAEKKAWSGCVSVCAFTGIQIPINIPRSSAS